MKKLVSETEQIKKYDDGSADIKCTLCGSFDALSPAKAERFLGFESNIKTFTCYKCWRSKGEEGKKDRLEQILLGQAKNMAVVMYSHQVTPLDEIDFGRLDELTQKFYEWITRDTQA